MHFQNQMLMRVNIKIFYLKEVQHPSYQHTPKMIFISHLQPLQISNKAKFHAFFEKFSHLPVNLKPAPTQDKFLNFLQNEFSHSKCFQKAFFTWMGVRAHSGTRKRKALAPPHPSEKTFWKHFECKNSFCKKSRNLSRVLCGFSFKWLKFSKNARNFSLFEIRSGCRCDMKIIC